jgi:EAL domain-containing protein (putative c-di-GMP-specific phosphodiesterase class I)/GGDEF domain-containing protein
MDKFVKQKNEIKTLFIVDILYMRDLNAVYGYDNGDYIIYQVLKLLRTKIKQNIIRRLTRLDKKNTQIEIINPYTDIFMIKIFGYLNTSDIKKIADMIISEISTYSFEIQDPDLNINIDLTVGSSRSDNEKLVIYAEKALHNAKLNYLNYSFFDPRFFNHEIISSSLVHILKNNINENKVIPYFHSIIDNNTDKVYKYEALMRLTDDEGVIMQPGSFMEQSKKYRLYPKLMILMLETVLETINNYKIHVSINFEYKDILNPLLKGRLISYMQTYDVGKYITIEILESEKITDFKLVKDFIREIREFGAKVAIDDFGSGFSNYEHILELDIDYIKLDGSLIQKVNEDIYYNLIKSIVLFCKKENIKVIAEFVKDISILRYVKSLDIDYSQGYYIAKPEPITTILKEIYEQQ